MENGVMVGVSDRVDNVVGSWQSYTTCLGGATLVLLMFTALGMTRLPEDHQDVNEDNICLLLREL